MVGVEEDGKCNRLLRNMFGITLKKKEKEKEKSARSGDRTHDPRLIRPML